MEPCQSQPHIEVISWFCAIHWAYDPSESNCAICKSPLAEPCPDCADSLLLACPPVTGACSHKFHVHCIEHWLVSGELCPLCATAWVVEEK
ncbi:RING-H2 zinc finger domain-containing protein [Giardia muris]|uniref:RING-H2 zinc finger domain-containing protein n=1 Tax=Giardia muris TaxID=5742 RepID=A0A4Z1T0R2_GIAMU|nr:RING-H2 zinc finger domain-containing protein [Giardia muris]|eukprot:TNJ26497.1 RING-H2 zinc finger domain-containing protein [Giardia muris]